MPKQGLNSTNDSVYLSVADFCSKREPGLVLKVRIGVAWALVVAWLAV